MPRTARRHNGGPGQDNVGVEEDATAENATGEVRWLPTGCLGAGHDEQHSNAFSPLSIRFTVIVDSRSTEKGHSCSR
ncbi:hypothetical protein GCM10018954_022470 [Kutzneria kofuensis]